MLLLVFLSLASVRADVRLPRLFNDGMILQRNEKIKIGGWANAGEKVTVSLAGTELTTHADHQGNWLVTMPRHTAGGPHQLVIQANNRLVVNDIYFGEVWLCSGQSNMELPMQRVKPRYEAEFDTANFPLIRCFNVGQTYNFKSPQQDVAGGNWMAASSENLSNFPAVAYFFAKELHQKLQVPVGLINASLGGSPAQAWMSEEGLKEFPAYLEEAYKFRDDELIKSIEKADNDRSKAWYSLATQRDSGQEGHYRRPGSSTNDWDDFELPSYWSDSTPYKNGVFWFRKEIDITASEAGKPAFLNMGCIVDADSVFINGQLVGVTTYQYPPRWYKVKSGVLKEGTNEIVIRVVSNAGKGGFVADKPYELKTSTRTIDLKGRWKMKQGAEMPPLASQTFVRWKPMGLYNAMIAPLLNCRFRGVIWYQGESNTGNPTEYSTLFPAMIRDWRKKFNRGDFPFLFVQLANFMEARPLPTESNWAATRESQAAALRLPATGMAVTIDIGEWNDIHPLNKSEVGERLALQAFKVAYNDKKVLADGPVFNSMKIKNGKSYIRFDNTGTGLVAKGGVPNGFAIAGSDGKFVWAQAVIDGNQVVVWHEDIRNPKFVRYAWADNPANANLANKEGLPAAPFRTDSPIVK
jgi:sialate O-acetylesterase